MMGYVPDKPTSEQIRPEAEKLRETAKELIEHAKTLLRSRCNLKSMSPAGIVTLSNRVGNGSHGTDGATYSGKQSGPSRRLKFGPLRG
jgi:hypothetical protein